MSEDQQVLDPRWDEDALVQEEKRRGIFSGQLLKKSNPEKYTLICHHLAAGLPIARISRLVQSSRNLIAAIKQLQPIEIEQEKRRIAGGAAAIIDLITEAQIDRLTDPASLKDISFRDLGVVKGIETDKFQVVTGGATSRVEVVAAVDGPGHDEYMAQIGFAGGFPATKGQRVIEVEVVDRTVDVLPPAAESVDPEEKKEDQK